jgi:FKBP-type peptidyl-prolyl cis-trans isomerase FkpA/FKBP-type peptidyl-prolyl cis-trans isomerase FklB
MISGAGIDSGIAASREKIDLSYANPREERTPMRKFLPVSVALVLTVAVAAGAAAPTLKSEDDKTLYALGLVISQNLASFNLTAAELEAVQAGIHDGVLKKEYRVDVKTYGPKIPALQTARAGALAATEKKAGQAFLDKSAAEKGATRTASGLIITTLKTGSGASPKAADKVKVHYHGTLVDGTVFDSSVQRGEPIVLPLGGVIKCWTEGVAMMKVGGKSRLVCPSDIAYGDQGRPPTIKGGATLVFEVELIEIVK